MSPSDLDTQFEQDLTLFMAEIRVSLGGAQILFAFLLSVPFTARFAALGPMERQLYFVSFLSSAFAALLLIAPSVYHRMHLHQEVADRQKMARSFNRLASVGAGFLALGMSCVVAFVTDLMFGRGWALGVALLTAFGFGWFWFGLPRLRYHAERRLHSVRSGRPPL